MTSLEGDKRETKWTPGKWIAGKPSSIVGWPIVASQGRVVASVAFMEIRPPHVTESEMARYRAECEANAQLISEAPMLYAALIEIAERTAGDIHQIANDATARARGEQP